MLEPTSLFADLAVPDRDRPGAATEQELEARRSDQGKADDRGLARYIRVGVKEEPAASAGGRKEEIAHDRIAGLHGDEASVVDRAPFAPAREPLRRVEGNVIRTRGGCDEDEDEDGRQEDRDSRASAGHGVPPGRCP